VGLDVTDEDRKYVPKNLKSFRNKHGDEETYKIIVQMVSRELAGLPASSPQRVWNQINGNGGKGRSNGHTRPPNVITGVTQDDYAPEKYGL